jgi:hypothetical protein
MMFTTYNIEFVSCFHERGHQSSISIDDRFIVIKRFYHRENWDGRKLTQLFRYTQERVSLLNSNQKDGKTNVRTSRSFFEKRQYDLFKSRGIYIQRFFHDDLFWLIICFVFLRKRRFFYCSLGWKIYIGSLG